MNSECKRRLSYVDTETTKRVLANSEAEVPDLLKLIADEPATLRQTRYAILAGEYETIARCSYAIGCSLGKVKESLSLAAHAHSEVFRMRGTEPAFPACEVRPKPSGATGDAEGDFEIRNLREDQEVDHSLTNSFRGYRAVCEALVSCQDALAGSLAKLIWDPPNAAYIGPRSFCTPSDQSLAYGLRELILGDKVAMEVQLKRLKLRASDAHIAHQVRMLRGIATNDSREFVDGLSAFLVWHRRMALAKRHRLNPEFFMCTTGLGLCRLALRSAVCHPSLLPQDNEFLPVKLIEGNC
ncbi:hypothetical protein Pan216_09810 [Planctomycetes bacterium Pan216]|uniref:Uncharacterized protein n=1 Tax=Kolteria novifilia TaxID=2527975 RepID=A0A518AZL4_9BACT|nr:hypothetical protein Pan216_09810 [Planctomycetes bacterium Pan216]